MSMRCVPSMPARSIICSNLSMTRVLRWRCSVPRRDWPHAAVRRTHARRRVPRLTVRSAGHEVYVPIPDIDWVEAADYYVCLHVGPKSHLLRRSMAELERDLDPHMFCRIHRSTIVNLRRVRAPANRWCGRIRGDSRERPEIALEPPIPQGSADRACGNSAARFRTRPGRRRRRTERSGRSCIRHARCRGRRTSGRTRPACRIAWRECWPSNEPRLPRRSLDCAWRRDSSCCAGAAVSKLPGSRLLMVTFLSATLRATPAMKAVRPARAPLDRSRPTIGILTL